MWIRHEIAPTQGGAYLQFDSSLINHFKKMKIDKWEQEGGDQTVKCKSFPSFMVYQGELIP